MPAQARMAAVMSVTGAPIFMGWAAGAFAADTHQPAQALRDQIEATAVRRGSRASKSGNRTVDQLWIECVQSVVPKTHLFHRASAIVFDQHIGVLEQARKHIAPLLAFEIQG